MGKISLILFKELGTNNIFAKNKTFFRKHSLNDIRC